MLPIAWPPLLPDPFAAPSLGGAGPWGGAGGPWGRAQAPDLPRILGAFAAARADGTTAILLPVEIPRPRAGLERRRATLLLAPDALHVLVGWSSLLPERAAAGETGLLRDSPLGRLRWRRLPDAILAAIAPQLPDPLPVRPGAADPAWPDALAATSEALLRAADPDALLGPEIRPQPVLTPGQAALLAALEIDPAAALDLQDLEHAVHDFLSGRAAIETADGSAQADLENIHLADLQSPHAGLVGLRATARGTAYVGLQVGGDWEVGVFAALLLGPDGAPRLAIPPAGNTLCGATLQAFGNEERRERAWLKAQGIRWSDDPDVLSDRLAPLLDPTALEDALDHAAAGRPLPAPAAPAGTTAPKAKALRTEDCVAALHAAQAREAGAWAAACGRPLPPCPAWKRRSKKTTPEGILRVFEIPGFRAEVLESGGQVARIAVLPA